MPPSLDKEPSDYDTRLCFILSARTRLQLPRRAVAAVTKAVSPPLLFLLLRSLLFFFFLFVFRLPTRCCCYHLSQKLIRLAACSHANRLVEYTTMRPAVPLTNTRIFEREKFQMYHVSQILLSAVSFEIRILSNLITYNFHFHFKFTTTLYNPHLVS